MSLASLEWGRTAGTGRKAAGFRGIVVDVPLLVLLLMICSVGFVVLYSALAANTGLLLRQGIRFSMGLAAFFVFSQIPPRYLRMWTPWVFFLGVALLGVLLSILLTEQGMGPVPAVAICAMVAMGLSLFYGVLITRMNMQPFIVTLCGLLFYRGLARFITHDETKGFGAVGGL